MRKWMVAALALAAIAVVSWPDSAEAGRRRCRGGRCRLASADESFPVLKAIGRGAAKVLPP